MDYQQMLSFVSAVGRMVVAVQRLVLCDRLQKAGVPGFVAHRLSRICPVRWLPPIPDYYFDLAMDEMFEES